MYNYFKNRYKFFIPLFILGFFIGFYSFSSVPGAPVFLLATLVGIAVAATLGNGFYYMYIENADVNETQFRVLKYIAFVAVLFIVTLTFYRIIVGN